MEKDRDSFELIHPADVGQATPEFVVGKHSGTGRSWAVLRRHGVHLERPVAAQLLDRIRELAGREKRALTVDEVLLLARSVITGLKTLAIAKTPASFVSPIMFSHTQSSLVSETVSVTVRPARITDLPGLVELLCQLFLHRDRLRGQAGSACPRPAPASGRRPTWPRLRRGGRKARRSRRNGHGSDCRVHCRRRTLGWIEDVVVRDDLRGDGIGTSLMASLSHWARTNGLARLQLLTDRRNRLALAFYDRLAFSTYPYDLPTQPLPSENTGDRPERQVRKRRQER